ncbi:hypothetical protein INR49_005321 [Caranx melampygus]|nr:hypothetical protein INR49_005321 [Caranx melampygus]
MGSPLFTSSFEVILHCEPTFHGPGLSGHSPIGLQQLCTLCAMYILISSTFEIFLHSRCKIMSNRKFCAFKQVCKDGCHLLSLFLKHCSSSSSHSKSSTTRLTLLHVNSNQCLDMPSEEDKMVPTLRDCNGSRSQQWLLRNMTLSPGQQSPNIQAVAEASFLTAHHHGACEKPPLPFRKHIKLKLWGTLSDGSGLCMDNISTRSHCVGQPLRI